MKDKQIEFLTNCARFESLGKTSRYIIFDFKTREWLADCQAADTCIMLITTKYKDIKVWIKRAA